MRFRFPFLLLTAILIAAGTIGATWPVDSSISAEIDALFERRQAEDAFWGAFVYDVEADTVVYSRNAEHGFLPASNQKVVTTAAALDALGSSHRYKTSLHFNGTATDSLMQGDLILRGSGDPTFGSMQIRSEDPLRVWADQLAEMGVERIKGRLVGDDRAFSGPPYPDGWTIQYLTRQKGRHIGSSAGALSYRDNVVSVSIEATEPGAPPNMSTRPDGVVSIENRAVTSSRWRGNTIVMNRTFSTNQLILTGSVARSYDGGVTVPVSKPTSFVLHSFEQHLDRAGIETELAHTSVDSVESPPSPGDPLFVQFSPTLAEIASIMNKESDNFYAEQVFRTYGWGGSSRGARRRTETFLRRAGIDTRRVRVQDGSGLSRKDLVTPQAIGELLVHMTDHPARDAFFASLPEGGERGTTMRYRLSGIPVHAKTGSMEFVRALSGYVERPNGNRVAFALFANNYTGPSYQISQTIDEVVRVLASTQG